MAGDQFLLTLTRAPGDTVALTAFLRDLKRQFSKISVGVRATGANELLAGNPHLDQVGDQAQQIAMDYRPGIDACKLGAQVTYLEEFHRDFFRKTGLEVPLTEPRPELHLTEDEKQNRPLAPRYWVVVAGHKWDASIKAWSSRSYQEVVDLTAAHGVRWVQVGLVRDSRAKHVHFPLEGVTNLIGQTTLRQLMCLIYHADGVLCGASMAMLMAAAFWRPCVVVAGGRENWQWLAFTRENPAWGQLASQVQVPHRFFHTIDQLDCCQGRGCWRAQVIPPHQDSAFPDKHYCAQPVTEATGQVLPRCMQLVTSQQVAQAVLSYYTDGTLPPLC